MNWRLSTTLLVVAAFAGLTLELVHVRRQRAVLAALKDETARVAAKADATRREHDLAVRLASSESGTPSSKADAGPAVNSPVSSETLTGRWLQKGRALRQLIDQHPDRQIPQMSLLTDEDLLIAAQTSKIDTDEDARRTLRTLRDLTKAKFVPYLQLALYEYAGANEDRIPTDISELANYLRPPLTTEMLRQYEIVRGGLLSQVPNKGWIAVEKVPVDDLFDSRWLVSANESAKQAVTPDLYATARAIATFASANAGRKPTTVSQLQPFLDGTVDPAAIISRFEQWQSNPETMGVRTGQGGSQTRAQLEATLPPL